MCVDQPNNGGCSISTWSRGLATSDGASKCVPDRPVPTMTTQPNRAGRQPPYARHNAAGPTVLPACSRRAGSNLGVGAGAVHVSGRLALSGIASQDILGS